MGISEAQVSIEGDRRIRVEMPGVDDAKTAINRIGETAQLRFTTADNTQYLDGEDIKDATAGIFAGTLTPQQACDKIQKSWEANK